MRFRNTTMTEFVDSPNERWGAGASSMTRTLDLTNGSFLSRLQAAYDIIGYAAVLPSGNQEEPFYIHRVTPMVYPGRGPTNLFAPPLDTTGVTPPDMREAFYAQAISKTEPLGRPTGIDQASQPDQNAAQYNRARLTIEFSTLPYQIKEDLLVNDPDGVPNEGYALSTGWQNSRYIIRHIQAFSRLIKIPYGLMWVNGKQTKTALPYREGGAHITYTWMRVPLTGGQGGGVPFSTIGAFLGTLNNATFDIAEPGTLLFDNYSTREYQGAFGERLADVTYNMIYLPHASTGVNFNGGLGPFKGKKLGWNYLYDIKKDANGIQRADYYKATTMPSGGDVAFASNDFIWLFAPQTNLGLVTF